MKSKKEKTEGAGLSGKLDAKKLKEVSKVFRAINHPLRLAIFKNIEENGRLSVTQIYFKLRIEQSVASQHLAILREAEILTPEREGKNIYYGVNEEKVKLVLECLDLLC